MNKLFQFYLADINKKNLFLLVGLFLILMYISLLIKTAWLGDDAYITFRTIDNFVNGYGLRWNIIERVQSYTHPLWLFLLSAIYFFTREIFFTAILTSIIISILTIYLLAFKFTRSYQNMVLVLLAVIFSKAFIDYSTSGLENPLTNLLLVLFFYVYFREGFNNNKKTFLLSLISSLILVNRMDCILLVLPAFIYYILKSKSYKHNSIILLGFLPFIIWEFFSLLYYGFPFPNTAYAKLNTGINRYDLISQGLKYFCSSVRLDPQTLTIIFLIVFLSIFKQNKIFVPLIGGVITYFIYIVWIGGDFMAGRFFTSPFMVILAVMAKIEFKTKLENVSLVLIVSLVGIFSLKNTLTKKYSSEIDQFGICDERIQYYQDSNLMDGIKGENMPSFLWAEWGRQAKENNLRFSNFPNTGFYGYFVGRQCYVLDELALCDPLLSRLPSEKSWRIGHFKRQIPDGYEETLKYGINKIKNPNLARFYDKIALITRGSLVSLNRLEAIWKINTGQYNYLIERIVYSTKSE